jgi:hypothetical protein
MTVPRQPKVVQISVLEYEDRQIPIPLFATSLGLMTGFTFIFPLFGFLTLPAALFVVFSILTGDITFVDDQPHPTPAVDEEE